MLSIRVDDVLMSLTTVIHANNSDACYCANHGVCSITTHLQYVDANMTADVAFRGHSAMLALSSYMSRRRSKYCLQGQKTCEPPHHITNSFRHDPSLTLRFRQCVESSGERNRIMNDPGQHYLDALPALPLVACRWRATQEQSIRLQRVTALTFLEGSYDTHGPVPGFGAISDGGFGGTSSSWLVCLLVPLYEVWVAAR